MRKLLYTAVAAAGLATASVSNAAVTVTSPSPAVYTPPATGGFIGVVAPSAGATASTLTPFSDLFSFTVSGVAGSFDSQVSSIQLLSGQDIDFSSVFLTLDGSGTVLGNYFKVSGDPNTEVWQCCGANAASLAPVNLVPGNYSVHLIGNLTGNLAGSYSGTVNLNTPLPEPATWAMMLLGFAGIGMAVRRRRGPVLAQLA